MHTTNIAMKAFEENQETYFIGISLSFILSIGCSLAMQSYMPLFIFIGIASSILFIAKPTLLYWLMIATIPISFEFTFSQGFSSDIPDEFLMILLTGITILIIIQNKPLAFRDAMSHPMLLIILLQIIWMLLASYFSTFPLFSFKYVIAKLWYIIPFVLAIQLVLKDKKQLYLLAKILVIPIVFTAIYSLYYHSYNQFSFLSINDSLQPFYRNHVNYGAMLSFGFSICFIVFFSAPKSKFKHLMGLLLFILTIALLFSYTRGTWISVILSIIAVYLLKKRKLLATMTMSFILVVVVFITLSVNDNYSILRHDFDKTIFQSSISSHLQAMYSMKEISGAERIHRWIAGVKMITTKPVVGFGPACFYNNYKPYVDTRFKTWVSNNPEKSSVHNYYLLMWIEQGFMGFLLFMLMLYYFFKRCQHIYFSINDPIYKQAIAILVMVMVNILVVNFFSDMIETDKVGTIFYLCIGVLIWIDIQFKQKKITFTTSE